MKKCPYCVEEIPEDSKVCKFCSSTVVKRCPSCAEEIVATARACRFCGGRFGDIPDPAPSAGAREAGPCGEERGVFLCILLTFLTCGIYGLVLLYKMGCELDAHAGGGRLKPGLDIFLVIVTCGFWGIVLMYKYPALLRDLTGEERRPVVDVTVPCLVLTIFGLQIVALAILQGELNQHWQAHASRGD